MVIFLNAIKNIFICSVLLFISAALFSLGVALFSDRGQTVSGSGACSENTCESCPLTNDCVEPTNVVKGETRLEASLLNPANLNVSAENSCADCQLFYACGTEANIDMSDLCLDADPFKLTGDAGRLLVPDPEAFKDFQALKAFAVSNDGSSSISVTGDPALLDRLFKQLNARFGPCETGYGGCDIVISNSGLVMKINEGANSTKNAFPF